MNDNKREKDYFKLLKSGMFWEMYPELTGDWDLDKKEFNRKETFLDENYRNKSFEQRFGKPKKLINVKLTDMNEKFEPLKQIKNVTIGNGYTSIPDSPKPTVTPLLVLYLDVSRVHDIQEAFDYAQRALERYERHGWTFLIIPLTDGRDSFVESHAIEKTNPIELAELQKQILELIKTGE